MIIHLLRNILETLNVYKSLNFFNKILSSHSCISFAIIPVFPILPHTFTSDFFPTKCLIDFHAPRLCFSESPFSVIMYAHTADRSQHIQVVKAKIKKRDTSEAGLVWKIRGQQKRRSRSGEKQRHDWNISWVKEDCYLEFIHLSSFPLKKDDIRAE